MQEKIINKLLNQLAIKEFTIAQLEAEKEELQDQLAGATKEDEKNVNED